MQDKPKQLYTLLHKLRDCVDDRNDYGMLVSYGILGSLVTFKPESNAQNEARFEEIKCAYTGLDAAIAACLRGDPYAPICEFRNALQPAFIDGGRTDGQGAFPSRILSGAVALLARKRGDHEDRLRRTGLELLAVVDDRGTINANKNTILTTDYTTLSTVYAGGRA